MKDETEEKLKSEEEQEPRTEEFDRMKALLSHHVGEQVSLSRNQSSEAIVHAQKTLILLNGGASVATLAFVPALLSLSERFAVELSVAIKALADPIFYFALGLVVCVVSIFVRHLDEGATSNKLTSLQIDFIYDDVPKTISLLSALRDGFLTYVCYALLAGSLGLFFVGVWASKLSIVFVFSE